MNISSMYEPSVMVPAVMDSHYPIPIGASPWAWMTRVKELDWVGVSVYVFGCDWDSPWISSIGENSGPSMSSSAWSTFTNPIGAHFNSFASVYPRYMYLGFGEKCRLFRHYYKIPHWHENYVFSLYPLNMFPINLFRWNGVGTANARPALRVCRLAIEFTCSHVVETRPP